ncbi:MAG: peptidase S9, partial [Prevotella sp.]|nr:peptidase S9 [Prevotella sp.]
MNRTTFIALMLTILAAAPLAAQPAAQDNTFFIGKNNITLDSDLMTPEALWAMGRIAGYQASPDGKKIVYQVGYYSKEQNKGHQVLYIMNSDGTNNQMLTTSEKNETDPTWINAPTAKQSSEVPQRGDLGGLSSRIAYLFEGQIWSMSPDGTNKQQLTHDLTDIDGFLFSPDGNHVILIKQLPYHESIKENPSDLPKASGRLVTDMNYRHWDEYVETIPHPFLADVTSEGINEGIDIMEGEPYESPVKPFGGIEQLAWSPDSKTIAYTSRKKTGVEYAISTDTDIYLYNLETKTTVNICKPDGYQEPPIDATKSMRNQTVNAEENLKNNPGYDMNPAFSPDGKYIAWLSMARNGYESDRNRLCIYDIATGEKSYVTESFDSNVDEFCWGSDSKTLYFIGVWHACVNIYQTDLKGNVMQLTDGVNDYGSLQLMNDGKTLLAERHSMSQGAELYAVTPAKKE